MLTNSDPLARDLIGDLDWVKGLTDAQLSVLWSATNRVVEETADEVSLALDAQTTAAEKGDARALSAHVAEYRTLQRELAIAESLLLAISDQLKLRKVTKRG